MSPSSADLSLCRPRDGVIEMGLKKDQFMFNADLYHDITGRHGLKMAFRIMSAYVLFSGSPIVTSNELILGLSEFWLAFWSQAES